MSNVGGITKAAGEGRKMRRNKSGLGDKAQLNHQLA